MGKRTSLLLVFLKHNIDEDTGYRYYECCCSRHYQNGDYCARWYMPTKASRKRLKRLGVTRYQGQSLQRIWPGEKWINPK